MFTCKACGHSEMTHQMFVGCCHVAGCDCLGVDGMGPFCTPLLHAAEHNGLVERPEPKTELEHLERRHGVDVTLRDRKKIIARKREGAGARTICGELNLPRSIVREVIIQELGKGPATTPRTRPRHDDMLRALDAGISPEELRAERVEGGRARTITSLNEWIQERAAS